VQRARGREAQRAGAHGIACERRHRLIVRGRGGIAPRAAFAHHIDAHGGVRQLGADIDVELPLRQPRHVIRKAFPRPRNPRAQDRLGNILDAFHELDQALVIAGLAGREADPAIAHDGGGNAVLRRGRDVLAPGDLAVIMGVNVDKARRHQFAAGVDFLLALAQNLADLADPAVRDGDVRFEQVAPEPVGDVAAADHEVWIAGHGVSPRCEEWVCRRMMGGPAMLSTAARERQECISLVSEAPEFACAPRSVTSASSTVRTMNTTDAPNTQCGKFWSMIQPNNSGLTMPPRLKPVETMPKARPAAPAGAALRTSISRDGAITPPRNPAAVIAAINSSDGKVIVAITSTTTALSAKQAAATWPVRWVWSARKPPANTPIAMAPRKAVSAILADDNDAP